MLKLISVLKQEIHLDIYEDHYIIDKILPSVLNTNIDEIIFKSQ